MIKAGLAKDLSGVGSTQNTVRFAHRLTPSPFLLPLSRYNAEKQVEKHFQIQGEGTAALLQIEPGSGFLRQLP